MALIATLGVPGVGRAEVPMEKVAAGARSGIATPRTVVVRDEAAWRALWNEAATGKPLPTVDFEQRMLVGIFLGARPTSGYSVQFGAARAEREVLVVTYTERRPSPRAMVMQVVTAPFGIASLPVHAGSVRFEPVRVTAPGPIR